MPDPTPHFIAQCLLEGAVGFPVEEVPDVLPDHVRAVSVTCDDVRYLLSRNTRQGEKPYRLTWVDPGYLDAAKIDHLQGDSLQELWDKIPESAKRDGDVVFYA